MNFAGHVEVARSLDAAPGRVGVDISSEPGAARFLLGSVLPDLAAMGRFRLLNRSDEPHLAAGIDIHHRTDDAFHRHPWFRSTSGALTADLDRAGLPRGAARACGHVGVELLLDGHLLARRPSLGPTVQATLEACGQAIGAVVGRGGHHPAPPTPPVTSTGPFIVDRSGGRQPAVAPDDVDGLGLVGLVEESKRDRWRLHLRRVAAWPVPADYDHPPAVAARLERILAHRPRLALPADGVVAVADALARRQHDVVAGADELLVDLRRDLTGAR